MTRIVVLQARTNSSRLPGKVLLPISGIPLVVLAAKRAANTGLNVLVATSSECTDDALVETLVRHGIAWYRGSLNNTLQRIVDGLNSYPDDTVVFRLTADNIFPDGQLLDEMEIFLKENGLRYLTSSGPTTGLPYGVSAELFYLEDLRESAQLTQNTYDQEHVTPFIRRKYGDSCFDMNRELEMSHYRATIDGFDDYVAMSHVFKGVANPVDLPLLDLIGRLKAAPFQPLNKAAAKKLVLGTIQLGLNYGVSNKTGKPDQSTATSLIKMAISSGIPTLDTARAYGNSERVIGQALLGGWRSRVEIVTKLDPLEACPEDAGPETVAAFVNSSVFNSCTELGVDSIDVLMLHRAQHRSLWNSAAWQHLKRLAENGTIKALGVSVQTPSELASCLEDSSVTYIQLPFNILDWRWDELIPAIRRIKSVRRLVIHVRSAFLQGLLLSQDEKLWCRAGVGQPESIFKWLTVTGDLLEMRDTSELCLTYCLSQDWIDGVVVGVETELQLRSNLAIADGSLLSGAELEAIVENRPRVEVDVLNPATWNVLGAAK